MLNGPVISGRITSIARSPVLGKVVAMAYVAPSQVEPGTSVEVRVDGGEIVNATVVTLPFYDPDGARQEM